MLKRKMFDYLKNWRMNKGQECLLIKGARQVGKSYIVQAFGRSEYKSFISIDFIENPQLRAIFSESVEPDDIYRAISLYLPGASFATGDTLIFLDEIQECPEARTALKYLALDGRYDVIASGSLLGIQYREGDIGFSVPVGYERMVTMHPLDFEEFLWAVGYGDDVVEELKVSFDKVEALPSTINNKMMRLFREYLAIGGMPSVVQAFVESDNYRVMFDEQTRLFNSYLDDIAKYASPTERAKARACFLSLPRQLAKENTKFQYSVVEKRGTARKFDGSIDWLVGANMVLRCDSVANPAFPLTAYEDGSKFRLYANDTGILMAMYGFDMLRAVIENELSGPMKGGLYENLVACVLNRNNKKLHYWIAQNGSREIEFLVDGSGASVVPIEVKSSRGSTVSLNEMLERQDVHVAYKLIDGNLGRVDKKITVPLYMAMFL